MTVMIVSNSEKGAIMIVIYFIAWFLTNLYVQPLAVDIQQNLVLFFSEHGFEKTAYVIYSSSFLLNEFVLAGLITFPFGLFLVRRGVRL
jgi:hypothetical protein